MTIDFAAHIRPDVTQSGYVVADAACDQSTGRCEYQFKVYHKVDFTDGLPDNATIDTIRMGPFDGGTNNIVEFLALVHALAECKKQGWDYPVYSDSVTAIAWVRDNCTNTKNPWGDHNKVLKDLCIRGIQWLISNYKRNKVMKWQTKEWGENPADFGYKR